jgi:hypothetical protein
MLEKLYSTLTVSFITFSFIGLSWILVWNLLLSRIKWIKRLVDDIKGVKEPKLTTKVRYNLQTRKFYFIREFSHYNPVTKKWK